MYNLDYKFFLYTDVNMKEICSGMFSTDDDTHFYFISFIFVIKILNKNKILYNFTVETDIMTHFVTGTHLEKYH